MRRLLSAAAALLLLTACAQEPEPLPQLPPTTVPVEELGAAPGFALPDLDGRERSLEEWQGEVVLVNFLASWCPPCIRELPLLAEVQEQYGAAGLQIVGIAVEEAEPARLFAEEFDLPFPVLVGGIGAATLAKGYGNAMGALPHSALIGRDGVIIRVHTGELHRPMVEEWLGAGLQVDLQANGGGGARP